MGHGNEGAQRPRAALQTALSQGPHYATTVQYDQGPPKAAKLEIGTGAREGTTEKGDYVLPLLVAFRSYQVTGLAPSWL